MSKNELMIVGQEKQLPAISKQMQAIQKHTLEANRGFMLMETTTRRSSGAIIKSSAKMYLAMTKQKDKYNQSIGRSLKEHAQKFRNMAKGISRAQRMIRIQRAKQQNEAQGDKTKSKTGTIIDKAKGALGAINGSIEKAKPQAMAEEGLKASIKGNAQAKENGSKALIAKSKALQQLGVLSDEAIISGQSQLAVYDLQVKSIQALSGGLADLAVKQYGYTAGVEELKSTGALMGDALKGNLEGLQGIGMRFTAEQARILKSNDAAITEQQKVAALSQAVASHAGGANAAAANTDMGKVQTGENLMGDLGQQIGQQFMAIKAKFMEVFIENFPAIQTAIMTIMEKLPPLAEAFIGALPSLGNFFNIVAEVFGKVASFLGFLAENPGIVMFVGGILLVVKVMGALWTILQVVKGLFLAISVVMTLVSSPILIAVAAVAALIAAFVKLNEKFQIIQKIKDGIGSIVEKAKGLFGGDDVKAGAGSPPPHHATGTSYWKGGWTHVNEGNRGEIIDLPNGSRIYPYDKSKEMMAASGGQGDIHIHIENLIGETELANRVGHMIAQKVRAQLMNM